MPNHPLSDETLAEAVRIHAAHNRSLSKAAQEIGIAEATLQHRLRRAAARGLAGGPPVPDAGRPPEGFAVVRNSATYDADGNLLRQSVQTRRDSGEPYAMPEGHAIKGESALLDPEGRVLARWVKTREDGSADTLKAIEDALARFDGKLAPILRVAHAEDDLLTVYPLPDLHLGMYAWGRETGENYDIDLAVRQATGAISALVAQSRPSKRAVLLGLGDYFHANGAKAATPASGHLLDVDGRWMKVKTAGAELALTLVDMIARRHEQVEVVFLPGNHDPDAATGLTVAVSMAYRKTARINVNTSPAIAWYRRFGRVLIGATHGHTMKPDAMALMLAADRAEDWGQADHRHFFFGHVHHESAKEVGAVRVESFAAPAARDAYGAAGGWRASRALSAITFHKNLGEIGRHRVGIATPRPRVRVRAGK
jgi:hypothetical protein